MKKYILPVIATVLCCSVASAFELDDFVLGGVRVKGIPSSQPALDGRYYYQFNSEGTMIKKYSYKKEKDVTTFFDNAKIADNPIKSWDGYSMSSDEKSILLWTNSNPIYRYSFTADHYIYNIKDNKLERLSDEGGEEIATLSPDGSKVAYVKNNNVYVKNLTLGEISTITTDGKKNEIINAVPDWVYQEEFGVLNTFTWSADGRYLAFIRFDESQVPMCSMELYQGECRPNPDYAIHPGRYDYKYPAAGEHNSVVSVYCYDSEWQKLSKIELPLAEEDYVPNIQFGKQPYPTLMVVKVNRAQTRMNIYAVDPANGMSEEVYDEQSDMWIDEDVVTGVKYYDGFFVVKSNRDGRTHLYKYNYFGKLLKQISKGDYDVTAYYGYDEAHKLFYFQTNKGALNRTIRCANDVTGEVKELVDGNGTYSASFNSDFTYYIRRFSDANTPDQFVLYSIDGKKVRDLQLNEEYAKKYTSAEIPRREFFTMLNDNGDRMNGYIIKPVDFDPSKKYPCIMSQYSGPNSQQVLNKWKMEWEEYFAMQGYIIACVDGRGTGGQGKEFLKAIYLNLGRHETEDQLAAARYMAEQPYVDADRIGIWGWSFGGFESLMAMSQDDSRYACGVAIAPVTSWKFYDSIYTERFMLTPQENPDGYNYAPLDLTDKLKGKLLLMFGSADDNVRIVNSMQYISKLHSEGQQFDMMVYPNMNHSINGCGVRLPLYQRVLNFFDANLKK
jgi:dipeptidyl-peptidase-4